MGQGIAAKKTLPVKAPEPPVEEDEPIMQTPVKRAPKDMSTSPEILSKLRFDAKTEQRRESKAELTATAVFTQPE